MAGLLRGERLCLIIYLKLSHPSLSLIFFRQWLIWKIGCLFIVKSWFFYLRRKAEVIGCVFFNLMDQLIPLKQVEYSFQNSLNLLRIGSSLFLRNHMTRVLDFIDIENTLTSLSKQTMRLKQFKHYLHVSSDMLKTYYK